MVTNEQPETQPDESSSPEPLVEPKAKFRIQQWEKIAAVAAVLLVLGYVTLAQNLKFWPFTVSIAPISTPTPMLSPTQTIDPLAGWQTYRNEKYGFEFRYPNDFHVEDVDVATPGEAFLYNYRYDFYPRYRGDPGGLTRFSNFSLSVNMDSVNSPEVYFARSTMSTSQRTFGPNAYTEARFKDRHEIRYLIKNPNGSYVELSYGPIIDTTDIGGLIYEPDYVAGVDVVRKSSDFLDEGQQRMILDQILSTFKFIESEICIQVITQARNPETGEVRDFPTPCDVPEGWEKI